MASLVLTQRLFPKFSELQYHEDGVNLTFEHRDAVDEAARASTRRVSERRQSRDAVVRHRRAAPMGEHESAAHDDVGRRPALGRGESQDVSHTTTEIKSCAEAVSVVPQSQFESGLRLVRSRKRGARRPTSRSWYSEARPVDSFLEASFYEPLRSFDAAVGRFDGKNVFVNCGARPHGRLAAVAAAPSRDRRVLW